MKMSVNRVKQDATAGKLTGRRSTHASGVAKITIALMAFLAVFVFGASSAWGASAWWHVSSSTRPTFLKSGYAENEVQGLSVDATGGRYVVRGAGLESRVLAFNASGGEVQAGVEELYGAGNVVVSGGPGATATGDLIGPGSGLGKVVSGSAKVEEVVDLTGVFVVGQVLEGAGIPAGTTISEVEGDTLTLSANATASAENVLLTGVASKTVTAFTPSGGVLEVGERVIGNGIPVGATIEAIDPVAHTLTLSSVASESGGTVLSSGLAGYEIEFVGALARTPVHNTSEEHGKLSAGGALTGSVTLTQVSEGRPDGEILAKVDDLGDAGASGASTPVKITDMLPGGLKALAVAGEVPEGNQQTSIPGCALESSVVSCSFTAPLAPLAPYGVIEVRVAVEVVGAVTGENTVSVSGGESVLCESVGAGKFKDIGCSEELEGGSYELRSLGPIADASVSRPVAVNVGATPFGVEADEMSDELEGGGEDRQAGSHQFQTTFSVVLNQGPDENPPPSQEKEGKPKASPAALPKDLNFMLPPGWIGNPSAFPRCAIGAFLKNTTGVSDECPADTAMGVATVSVLEPEKFGAFTEVVPVFNLEPRSGEPARFGFYVPNAGAGVYIDASVRTGSDYGIVGHVENITQIAGFLSSEVSFWGVPGDARHNVSRGWGCLFESKGKNFESQGVPPCLAGNEQHPPAFLSLPASCTGPLSTSVSGDSWEEPGNEHELAKDTLPGLRGCNRLPFSPSITVTPDGQAASSSTGVKVNVHVPQEETLNAGGLAETDVRAITVALPAGVAVNPSGGDGLAACTGTPGALGAGELGSPGDQVGFEGSKELPSLPGLQTALFTHSLPGKPPPKQRRNTTNSSKAKDCCSRV